jgi:quercetin dioxygenase-like cupin family protein
MESVSIAQWTLTGPPPDALPGAGATMRQVHIKAGHIAARHSHPYEQFLHVLSGGGKLQCEAGSVTLQPGTAIHFAPGAWHSAEFTAETVLLEVNLAEAAASAV